MEEKNFQIRLKQITDEKNCTISKSELQRRIKANFIYACEEQAKYGKNCLRYSLIDDFFIDSWEKKVSKDYLFCFKNAGENYSMSMQVFSDPESIIEMIEEIIDSLQLSNVTIEKKTIPLYKKIGFFTGLYSTLFELITLMLDITKIILKKFKILIYGYLILSAFIIVLSIILDPNDVINVFFFLSMPLKIIFVIYLLIFLFAGLFALKDMFFTQIGEQLYDIQINVSW